MSAYKIIIDVCHPCEVHHYKYLYENLKSADCDVLFTAKDKDVTIELLEAINLPYTLLSANRGGIVQKLIQLPLDLYRFFKVCRSFRPDILVSAVSIHAAWIGWLLRIRHFAFIDTEPRYLLDTFTLPFVDYKITSYDYYRNLGKHHIRYHGNHELAYLHPNRFRSDPKVLEELGVKKDEPFLICRFVAWKASHDIGKKGMSDEQKIAWIQKLSKSIRIFISSEVPLPEALQSFLLKTHPKDIHSVLAFAQLYVGEGITMASEAVTLGTPAVLINELKMGYCINEAEYEILFQFDALTEHAIRKIEELLNAPPKLFKSSYHDFLKTKIDVTEFMTELIINKVD